MAASKSKEVYKTIKRSISATTNGIVGNGSSLIFGTSRTTNGSAATNGHGVKQWIHPPEALINGRVEYTVKFLGQKEVNEPKGTHVVRDAICAIRFHLQVQKGVTGHSGPGSKLRRVIIQISVDGVSVLDAKTRSVLFKHPIHHVSFCADDKQDKRVFSYIAKSEGNKHECFVFLSDKFAEKITFTIGEAFDLAYERFLKKRGRDLEGQKQMILLRKRVAELEAENSNLKAKLMAAGIKLDETPALISTAEVGEPDRPLVPTTPIPLSPPVLCGNTSNGLFPLAPPPQSSRRANAVATTNNLLSLNDLFMNVQNDAFQSNFYTKNPAELFDDDFDPRADEKSKQIGHTPLLENKPLEQQQQNGSKVVENFEALLRRVDEKYAAEYEAFQGGLARGDTGDSGRDLDFDEPKEKDELDPFSAAAATKPNVLP